MEKPYFEMFGHKMIAVEDEGMSFCPDCALQDFCDSLSPFDHNSDAAPCDMEDRSKHQHFELYIPNFQRWTPDKSK